MGQPGIRGKQLLAEQRLQLSLQEDMSREPVILHFLLHIGLAADNALGMISWTYLLFSDLSCRV